MQKFDRTRIEFFCFSFNKELQRKSLGNARFFCKTSEKKDKIMFSYQSVAHIPKIRQI